jgi:hypothetical protein
MFMDQGGYAQLKAFAKERPPTEEEVGNLLHCKHIAAVFQASHGVAWYCRWANAVGLVNNYHYSYSRLLMTLLNLQSLLLQHRLRSKDAANGHLTCSWASCRMKTPYIWQVAHRAAAYAACAPRVYKPGRTQPFYAAAAAAVHSASFLLTVAADGPVTLASSKAYTSTSGRLRSVLLLSLLVCRSFRTAGIADGAIPWHQTG